MPYEEHDYDGDSSFADAYREALIQYQLDWEDMVWGKNHRAWTLIDQIQPGWGLKNVGGLMDIVNPQPRPLTHRRSPWSPDFTTPDDIREAMRRGLE